MKDSLFDFTGIKGIVTGGSQGIGRECALALAARGAELVIAARTLEKAQEVADEIIAAGGKAYAIRVDASDRSSVEAMVEEALGYLGRFDLLINALGINARVMPGESYSDTWHRILNINLHGVYNCCELVGEQMIKQKSGNIINFSSIAGNIVSSKNRPGRAGEYGLFGYATSKAAIKHFTRLMACLWAEYGIRANCLSPGYTTSPMTKELHDDPVIRNKLEQSVPMKFLAETEDMVTAVLYLASPASRYTTAQDIIVDGGLTVK